MNYQKFLEECETFKQGRYEYNDHTIASDNWLNDTRFIFTDSVRDNIDTVLCFDGAIDLSKAVELIALRTIKWICEKFHYYNVNDEIFARIVALGESWDMLYCGMDVSRFIIRGLDEFVNL